MKILQLIILVVCAVGAAVMAFFGLRSQLGSGGVEGFAVPAMMAVVAGVGLGGVWHFILTNVPKLIKAGAKTSGLLIAGALTVTAAAITSWFAATSISGRSAVRAHESQNLTEQRRVSNSALANAALEQQIVPDLRRAAAEYRALAELERRTGQISGRPGPGAVTAMLERVADAYEALVEQARHAMEKAESLRVTIATRLKMMDEIVAGNDVPELAQKRYATALSELHHALAELNGLSFLLAVKRIGVTKMPMGSGVTPGQMSAIDRIDRELQKTSENLGRTAEALVAQKQTVELVSFTPMRPGDAVIEYAGSAANGWTVGVALDLLPLILLALLVTMAIDRSGGGAPPSLQWAPQSAGGPSADPTGPNDPRRGLQVVPAAEGPKSIPAKPSSEGS